LFSVVRKHHSSPSLFPGPHLFFSLLLPVVFHQVRLPRVAAGHFCAACAQYSLHSLAISFFPQSCRWRCWNFFCNEALGCLSFCLHFPFLSSFRKHFKLRNYFFLGGGSFPLFFANPLLFFFYPFFSPSSFHLFPSLGASRLKINLTLLFSSLSPVPPALLGPTRSTFPLYEFPLFLKCISNLFWFPSIYEPPSFPISLPTPSPSWLKNYHWCSESLPDLSMNLPSHSLHLFDYREACKSPVKSDLPNIPPPPIFLFPFLGTSHQWNALAI